MAYRGTGPPNAPAACGLVSMVWVGSGSGSQTVRGSRGL